MSAWYFSVDGRQSEPMAHAEAAKYAAAHPDSYCWRSGFNEWQLAATVGELQDRVPPPPTPAAGRRHRAQADEIDYRILGHEMQYVEVELDPGESAVAEAGSMMYMTEGIEMTTVFGDGSAGDAGGGLIGKLMGAGKRLLTGESLFMTVFTNNGRGKQQVAFAAPYAGKILPMDLAQLGGTLICQKDSFLCAAKGVSIGIAFQRRFGVGLFGGEGFIMQKLEGNGLAFVHAGGTVHPRELRSGEVLRVDTGCIVALQPSIDYDIQLVRNVKTAFFGGEGLFFATLKGPGHAWLQSLPLSRLAGRIFKAAPQGGGKRQGEGSILGGLGDLLDGS